MLSILYARWLAQPSQRALRQARFAVTTLMLASGRLTKVAAQFRTYSMLLQIPKRPNKRLPTGLARVNCTITKRFTSSSHNRAKNNPYESGGIVTVPNAGG